VACGQKYKGAFRKPVFLKRATLMYHALKALGIAPLEIS
jgi:hypothetical protein